MDVKTAMIIKTTSDEQTKSAKTARNLLSHKGEDIVIVPHGATDLFITFEKEQLAVIVKRDDEDLDVAVGFDDLSECHDYALTIARESGLSVTCIDQDVYDVDQ